MKCWMDVCIQVYVSETTFFLSKDLSLDFSRGMKNCRLREEFFLIETY